MDDGAGDELWEESDEEAVVDKVVFVSEIVFGVEEVGDLLEGVEGDGDGEDNGGDCPCDAEECVGGFGE